MTEFMQIVMLQNETFNMWAWIIGTVLWWILVGVDLVHQENTKQYDEGEAYLMAFFAPIWPIMVAVLLVMAIPASIVWIGKYIGNKLALKQI